MAGNQFGFKTNLIANPVTYYISRDNLDSSKIVLSMVDELFRTKYSDITFYCHNLSQYDIVFILKVLYDYNDLYPENKYNISCILRDDKIIKISKGKNSFTIVDSYIMLSDKLITLGENFWVSTLKSKFPYKFALEDNLFYEGNTPLIDFYKNITQEEYDNLNISHISYKNETIKYLKNDIL